MRFVEAEHTRNGEVIVQMLEVHIAIQCRLLQRKEHHPAKNDVRAALNDR